jgi:Na+-translocating ferredoxin:NAD+ oxidoreductase RnfG subunit
MFDNMKTAAMIFSLLILASLAPPNVHAERIWDSELKRWLTPEELGHQEIFLSEERALTIMLPKSTRIRKEVIQLKPDQKQAVEARIGWKFPEESFEIYIGETDKVVDGYAMIQNTIGKHKPMTYMVGVDADGHVIAVELMVFRESRGSEVRTKRFNYQYEGKTVQDPVRINKDIINISGATMSVRSMSAGVKRVLVLVDEFYLKPIGRGSDTRTAKRADKGFFQSLFGD